METTDGRPNSLACEMLGRARALMDESGGSVLACVLGHGMDGVGSELIAHGADRVYVVDAALLAGYQADAWLPDLVDVVRQARPDAVMVGHTAVGADLAPRLAFRLGTAIATSCIEMSADDGKLLLTRPCYGGKANEVISIVTKPAVLTVKPKSFAPPQAQTTGPGKSCNSIRCSIPRAFAPGTRNQDAMRVTVRGWRARTSWSPAVEA